MLDFTKGKPLVKLTYIPNLALLELQSNIWYRFFQRILMLDGLKWPPWKSVSPSVYAVLICSAGFIKVTFSCKCAGVQWNTTVLCTKLGNRTFKEVVKRIGTWDSDTVLWATAGTRAVFGVENRVSKVSDRAQILSGDVWCLRTKK